MIWNVVYTISMGKHGNQRIPSLFNGSEKDLLNFLDHVWVGKAVSAEKERKSFPTENILLIEWSEVKK